MGRRAPKGRSNEAQAEGLGQQDPNRYPSPEGAEQSFSIPHVPLVVGDSVRVQQLPEFLLKADRAVVAFLLCDVRGVAKANAAWGNTYIALSGLGAKLGGNLNPGRWPGLRYFAPLGLSQRPAGDESSPLWGSRDCVGMVSKPRPLTWVSNTADEPPSAEGVEQSFLFNPKRTARRRQFRARPAASGIPPES